MDKETFANFISNCGKRDFEIACRIVLQNVFNLNVVNVDGTNDGGTDFTSLDESGQRTLAAYQITTQKTDIKNKAYRDAKKCINKLGAKRYYFLCSYNLPEINCRELENLISTELNIIASVFSPTLIADLMLNYKLVGAFLNRIGYPDLYQFESNNVDYREMALHSYSFMSADARNLKSQIYDDALLLILSDYGDDGLNKNEIVSKATDLLALPETREEFLLRRIDSLLSKGKVSRHPVDPDRIVITAEVKDDIRNRKSIYELELSDLSAAQVDIMKDYGISWTDTDSRQVSVWIANSYISKQLKTLESASATIADNFYKKVASHGYSQLMNYLKKEKKIQDKILPEVVDKLMAHASTHPLITKITSASVYLALEGGNPISACKALGASRWQEVNLLIEPTIGIPFLCSSLYRGKVNKYFDYAIYALNRAKEFGISLYIPYYYIKECAGHLHMARKFNGLDLNADEMQFSSNAFVSNYYTLKSQGIHVPDVFMDYLATFSAAIRTEYSNYRDWIRAIMNDIQSRFTRNNVSFQNVPQYAQFELNRIETEYRLYLEKKGITKRPHLMRNDVMSLHFTDEMSSRNGEHWMILTYDTTLINVSKESDLSTWVSNPFTFIEITEMSKDLTEKKLSSIVHSMAAFSDKKTLEIGARILDRIILYASDKMQDWEFQEDIKKFKEEMVESISPEDKNFMTEVDKKTIVFLANHGVELSHDNDEQNEGDVDVDLETELDSVSE